MAKDFDDLDSKSTLNTTNSEKKQSKYARYLELEEEIAKPVKVASGEVKRINMAFTTSNYDMIREESERFGVTMAYLVNALVRIMNEDDVNNYIGTLRIKPNKNHIPRRKGAPSKRINIALEKDVYSIIEKGANQYDMTLTQYLNIVLDAYMQEEKQ